MKIINLTYGVDKEATLTVVDYDDALGPHLIVDDGQVIHLSLTLAEVAAIYEWAFKVKMNRPPPTVIMDFTDIPKD